MEENAYQLDLFGSSSGSSRDDIGWYSTVRDEATMIYEAPANLYFLA
jgi:hypothetical protein